MSSSVTLAVGLAVSLAVAQAIRLPVRLTVAARIPIAGRVSRRGARSSYRDDIANRSGDRLPDWVDGGHGDSRRDRSDRDLGSESYFCDSGDLVTTVVLAASEPDDDAAPRLAPPAPVAPPAPLAPAPAAELAAVAPATPAAGGLKPGISASSVRATCGLGTRASEVAIVPCG